MSSLIDTVDFSYMDFPDGSEGRVLGRRKEAHKLAKAYCEKLGANYDEFKSITPNSPYISAYTQICIWEADKMFGLGRTKDLEKIGIKI